MPAILITFDHLAAHRLGPYGNYDGRTPTFDQLASRSAVFHNALCHSVPAPGIRVADDFLNAAPALTFPLDRVDQSPDELPKEWIHRGIEGIRNLLESRDSSCLWISSPGIPDPWIPSHAGWEESVAQKLKTTWNELLADESPSMTPEQAVRELADTGHFSRIRRPDTPDRAADRLSLALYQTCAEKLDERLGRLVREYQRHAKPESLLIVAGLQGDRLPFSWPIIRETSLCSEVVQVPLFVQPGLGFASSEDREAEGATILELVQTTEIWSTIRSWIDRQSDSNRPGIHLLDVASRRHPGRDRMTVESSLGERLIRTRASQLIVHDDLPENGHDRDVWLTTKPDDIWDLLNVAAQNPELIQELLEPADCEPRQHESRSNPLHQE